MTTAVATTPAISQRDALARATGAYDEMYRRLVTSGGTDIEDVARPTYERGMWSLQQLARQASDVALSEDAREALAAYVHSLRVDDPESQLMWLGMFPDAVRGLSRTPGLPPSYIEVRWSSVRVELEVAPQGYRRASVRRHGPPFAA
jgi:hypothetical protein